MTLVLLILLPFLGGVAALVLAGRGEADRWVSILSLAATLVALVLAVVLGEPAPWFVRLSIPWAPSLGVSLTLALDGLSASLVAIAAGLGIVGVMVSWREVQRATGLFHAALCWTVATSNGVFLAFDLLVFAFFWEAMIVPSFLLIALWGHGDREAAALKFLIFNAVAGLALIAAVVALAAQAPVVTFDAFALAGLQLDPTLQLWLLLGFALAFLAKLPGPPVHAWLPDAHTQAPTAGSILLAGLLLKTGAYGLFRFPGMLFPDAMIVVSPWGMALGAFGAIYGGLVACAQHDGKRLIAYSSIAHMSIVLLGVSALEHLAMVGAAIEMIAHAFSASALFLLIGALYERTHTRDLRQLGGLQQAAPRFAASFSLFFAAALAMPGTANFVGEVLVVVGVFQVNWVLALVALSSLIVSVVYATRMLRGIVFGPKRTGAGFTDLGWRELAPTIVLAACTVVIGFFPQFLIDWLEPAVDAALARFAPP
jgi:NADH-quinone oxidoreductase subunit M